MNVLFLAAALAAPLQLLDTDVTGVPTTVSLESLEDCQPYLFIPGETEVADHVVVSNSAIEAAEHTIRVFSLRCPASSDWVVEILDASGERVALYTHVDWFEMAPDKARFYLRNFVNTGTVEEQVWELRVRVIEVATRDALALPHMDCTRWYDPVWMGDELLTLSGPNRPTDEVCIFGASATPRVRFQTDVAWQGNLLYSQISWDPGNPQVLRHLNPLDCTLDIVDTRDHESAVQETWEREDAWVPFDCPPGRERIGSEKTGML